MKAYFGDYVTLYRGQVYNRTSIAHQACCVAIGLGEPLAVMVDNKEHHLSLAVIPSMLRHQIIKDNEVLFIFFEPHLDFAKSHRQFASQLHTRYTTFQNMLFERLWEREGYDIDLAALYGYLCEALSFTSNEVDHRILHVRDFIVNHLYEDLHIQRLADHANLSVSRFQHLFKQTMGIPVVKYIHWQRLKTTCELILQGTSMTVAAHQGGFADSAHFSRMFGYMFGMTPTSAFKK